MSDKASSASEKIASPPGENQSSSTNLPKSLRVNPKVANPLIPRLVDLCLETIKTNFDKCTDLHLLPKSYQTRLLQVIPADFSLPLAVMTIPDGSYWKRRLLKEFPKISHDPQRKVWKRLYLEEYSSQKLENATSATIDDIFEELHIFGPYIREIHMNRTPCKVSIFKLFHIFRGLKKLTLVYGEPRRSFAAYEDFDQFDVSENSATLQDCKQLKGDFEQLGQFCSLRELNMSDNSLADVPFQHICKGLCSLVSLTSLTFSHNEISNNGCHAVATVMLKSPLVYLDLSDNKIGPEGCGKLVDIALTSKTLKYLNLGSNQIGDKGAQHIGRLMKGTASLEHLDISGNRITKCHDITEGLKENNTLREFILAANPIDDNEFDELERTCSELKSSLDIIDLRRYQLTEEDFQIKTTETSEAPLLRFK